MTEGYPELLQADPVTASVSTAVWKSTSNPDVFQCSARNTILILHREQSAWNYALATKKQDPGSVRSCSVQTSAH